MNFRKLGWIKRGSQKKSVFSVLKYPMSSSEIFKMAKKTNPKITFSDVTNIIREAERREIISCLTSDRWTGRVYYYSEYGRTLVRNAYEMEARKPNKDIDWDEYAKVIAGKNRRHVLNMFDSMKLQHVEGMTVSQIRRKLNVYYPISLNQTLSAVQSLIDTGLVSLKGFTKKRNAKLYGITPEGSRISEYLLTLSQ